MITPWGHGNQNCLTGSLPWLEVLLGVLIIIFAWLQVLLGWVEAVIVAWLKVILGCLEAIIGWLEVILIHSPEGAALAYLQFNFSFRCYCFPP